jgi:hypothetical protein
MTRINLLAAERPTKKKKGGGGGGGGGGGMPSAPGAVQAYLILALFAGGAALVCVVAFLMLSSQIKDLDQKIAAAEQRQRELQVIKQQVDALERKRATFQRKVDLITRLQAEQQGPVHMLDEISNALPDFVWLTSLEQAGNQVRFGGQSNSLTSVADFITGLQNAGPECGKNPQNPLDRSLCWFPDVNLVSSTEANNLVTFALAATFSNPEAVKKVRAAQTRPIPGASPAPAAPAR